MSYQPEGLPILLLDKIVGLFSDPRTKEIKDSFTGKKFMCKFPNGQIYFESKLALDTDGSRFAVPDANGNKEDPSGQASTSAIDADGNFLDAEFINYFVLPGGFYGKHGIRIGDIGVVIRDVRMCYACFGDVGPSTSLGEGSIALHRELGHETVRWTFGQCRPTGQCDYDRLSRIRQWPWTIEQGKRGAGQTIDDQAATRCRALRAIASR
jgi:hypothetical protein